ncbi:dipeptide ABC transporter ATP-binding protein [Cupriavidus basilensis OR16]|uniref:Dipeptide ABC transporter ATP-binding protein n=1 Tax=Cupriavidus basilensis OR16 TaxID=1127483 RepID=H1S8V8_9BURK|nr:dipeptide ABC transporter ATP-binding protein [Cupriavidus basilensis OR16]
MEEFKAVSEVSLRLALGETLGLVGESGCGKSTLAKMLLGLLAPSEGSVLINGREVLPTERKAMSRFIQPIFQDPYSSLNPRKTVAQIVGLPLRLHGLGSAAGQAAKVVEMLDLVGMPKRTHGQYPAQLSGGQRQRVAIARALMLRPQVLIGVVEHLADRVAVMYRGSIVEQASREAIFSAPAHPYTRMLLSSALTPEPGLGIPDIKRDFETLAA